MKGTLLARLSNSVLKPIDDRPSGDAKKIAPTILLRQSARRSHQEDRDPDANAEIGTMPNHESETPVIVVMINVDNL